MNIGTRQYRQASCRIAIPTGLPDEMQHTVREVLGVISDSKRSGEATALLHQVTAEADFAWITLFIHVEPFDGGMTVAQLYRFYSRFGFKELQIEPFVEGQLEPLLMSRSPVRPKIVRPH